MTNMRTDVTKHSFLLQTYTSFGGTANPYALDETFIENIDNERPVVTINEPGDGVYLANPTIPAGTYVRFDDSSQQHYIYPRVPFLNEFKQKVSFYTHAICKNVRSIPQVSMYVLKNSVYGNGAGYFNYMNQNTPLNTDGHPLMPFNNAYFCFLDSGDTEPIYCAPMLGATGVRIGITFETGLTVGTYATVGIYKAQMWGWKTDTNYNNMYDFKSNLKNTPARNYGYLALSKPSGTQDWSFMESDFIELPISESDVLVFKIEDTDLSNETLELNLEFF